jgi:hypothetical protein
MAFKKNIPLHLNAPLDLLIGYAYNMHLSYCRRILLKIVIEIIIEIVIKIIIEIVIWITIKTVIRD